LNVCFFCRGGETLVALAYHRTPPPSPKTTTVGKFQDLSARLPSRHVRRRRVPGLSASMPDLQAFAWPAERCAPVVRISDRARPLGLGGRFPSVLSLALLVCVCACVCVSLCVVCLCV